MFSRVGLPFTVSIQRERERETERRSCIFLIDRAVSLHLPNIDVSNQQTSLETRGMLCLFCCLLNACWPRRSNWSCISLEL